MDTKISQLPELTTLQGSEDIVISVNSVTYRVRPSTLGNFLSLGNGHTHSIETVNGLKAILDTIEANLALKASTADLRSQLETIMGGVSPDVLDTIKEISDALQADQTVTQTIISDLAGKADKASVDTALAGKSDNSHSHSKSEIGLGNVDNTSDADKPISNAMALSLVGKAAVDHTHSRSDVGLNNVDNTSDTDKPISTATQTALDNIQSQVNDKAASNHTHTVTVTDVSGLTTALDGKSDSSHTHTFTKADIGLGNVDNTSDVDKPISTAVQTALDSKTNTQYVDSQLQLKANVDQLTSKADITYVDSAISDKVSNSDMMLALSATAASNHVHTVSDITDLETYVQARIADALLPKFDVVLTPGTEAFNSQIDFTRLNSFILSNLSLLIEYKGVAQDDTSYITATNVALIDGTYSYTNTHPMTGVGSGYEANIRVTLINTKDLDNKLVIKQFTLTTL